MDTPASYQTSYDYAADRQDRGDARCESIAADLIRSSEWVHDTLRNEAEFADLLWDMAVKVAAFKGSASVDEGSDFVEWLMQRLGERAALSAKAGK